MHQEWYILWTTTVEKAFQLIKRHLMEVIVLQLPNFDQPFKMACDTSHIGIGGVLSQQGHLIAFFSKKLDETRCRYLTYDLEIYAAIQSLRHWRHYLIH